MAENRFLVDLINEAYAIKRIPHVGDRQMSWHQWRAKMCDIATQDADLRGLPASQDYREIDRDISELQSVLWQKQRSPLANEESLGSDSEESRLSSSDTEQLDPDPRSVRVFLSYLSKDDRLARIVEHELQTLSPDRVKVFRAGGDVRSGTKWKDDIHKKLRASDWLLMLYTDPDNDWEWPIREATAFETMRIAAGSGEHRLCCLHVTEKFPRTLHDYQHHRVQVFTPDSRDDGTDVAAVRIKFYEESRLHQFLKDFVAYPDADPLVSSREKMRNRLVEIAEKIAIAFQDAITDKLKEFKTYPPLLKISVYPDSDPTTPDLDENALVELNPESASIFDIAERSMRWGDFLRLYAQSRPKLEPMIWVNQLREAINTATNGGRPNAIFAVLYSQYRKCFLRPVMTRQDIHHSGKRTFFVVLIEQPVIEMCSQQHLGPLLASLTFASRFRFEFLDAFLNQLQHVSDDDALETSWNEAVQRLIEIEAEAAQHGLTSPEVIVPAFGHQDQAWVEKQFNRWYEIRERLFALNYRMDGAPSALSKIRQEISALLDELQGINSGYIQLAIRRYSELMDVTLDEHQSAAAPRSRPRPNNDSPAATRGPARRSRTAGKKAAPKKKAGAKRKVTAKKKTPAKKRAAAKKVPRAKPGKSQ